MQIRVQARRSVPGGSRRTRGQAVVEFALVLPVAVIILALAATGGQMLMAAIDITQAARAGASAAQGDYKQGDSPATQLADARTSAQQELGVGSIRCQSGGSVPVGCVSVSPPTISSTSGETLITVRVWETVDTFVPILGPAMTVSGTATAAG
ncbi:MAG: TadE family protein [Candidatus Dormiibacterota bacterium]